MKSTYYTAALLLLTITANVALGQEYGNVDGERIATKPAPKSMAVMVGKVVEHGKLVEYKADQSAAVYVVSPAGDVDLFHAAAIDDVAAIQAYISKGGDLNVREAQTGETLLMRAVKYKAVAVIETLLQYTTNNFPDYPQAVQVDAIDKMRQTALHHAAKVNEATGDGQYILHLLLDAGANPNVVDFNGNTPLVNAIEKNQSYTLYALLQEGADPEAKLIQFGGKLISAYEYAEGKGDKRNFASRELLAWRDRNILKRATDAVAHFSYEVLESTPVLQNHAHMIYRSGVKTIYDNVLSGVAYYTSPVVGIFGTVTSLAVGIIAHKYLPRAQQQPILPVYGV